MHRVITAFIMLADIMNLSVAIVARGNAIRGACRQNLIRFEFAKGPALFGQSGLQEATAAATAIIVRSVGYHINKILFSDDRFDYISQIFGNRIAKRLAYNLTGILHGKFNLEVLVPVGIDLESSLPDPFGIVFIDVFDDKVVLDVELFQSCQD